MSTELSSEDRRQPRRAAMPSMTASSQNSKPPNSNPANLEARTRNSQMEIIPKHQTTQPTTPPRTPRRDNKSAQYASNSAAPETASKQRSRQKNRPKNVMTSPAGGKTDRNTPPLTGSQSAAIPSSARAINTPSTAAYAGSTFHASPAPSALPLPSFYSKSVPESPGLKGLKSVQGSILPTTTTPGVASATDLSREESPLDLFFKADREEKARARSASSTKAFTSANGPFPPPAESPRHNQTPPLRAQNANRLSAGGIFAMEMDSDRGPSTPYGPAFSTPYSERINAARSGRPSEQPFQRTQSSDNSEALKAYLFSSQNAPSQRVQHANSASAYQPSTNCQPSATHPGPPGNTRYQRPQNGNSFASTQPGNGPSNGKRLSGLRQEVAPSAGPAYTDHFHQYAPLQPSTQIASGHSSSTPVKVTSSIPTPGASSAASDLKIQNMEDSLRKLLKLDSIGPSGSNGGPVAGGAAGIFQDYPGATTAPMNGRHNGFMGS